MPVRKYRRLDPKPVDLVQAGAKSVLNIADVAALLSLKPWTVRQFIAQGELKTLRLPSTKGSSPTTKRVLIARDDLDAFIAKYRPAMSAVKNARMSGRDSL